MVATVKAPTTMRINDRELPAMPHQVRFLNIRTRNPALVGGYGCGKSHVLLRKALQGAAENPGLIGIYACLTYPVLRDAILPELWQVLAQYDLREGWDYSFNGSSMTLTLHLFQDESGRPSVIYFRPVEGKTSLGRMIAITAAWACLDEAALMSEEAYRKVSERVRDKRARNPFVAAATTPEGFNWVYDKWVKEPRQRAAAASVADGLKGDEQYRFVRGRTEDNPNLDKGYIDSLRQQYDARLVQAYLEGHFVPMFEGLCFRFSEHEHVDSYATYDPHLPICMAWDFNVNPMSVTLNHWHKGELWTFDEIVRTTSHTDDVCEHFLSIYGGHMGGVRIYGDAAGRARSTKAHVTDYDIIRDRLGHMPGYQEHFPTNNPSQRESINTLNALLKNGHGHVAYGIHPSCVETIRSWQTTVYDDNNQIYKGEDAYEHLTDGLRYLAWAVAPIHESLRRGRAKRTGGARVR
jgi:hypothetical protein